MKVILDSGVWWRMSLRLPMKKPLADFLKHDVSEWWLSPFAAAEMLYKVNHKKLIPPADGDWLAEAVRGGCCVGWGLGVVSGDGLHAARSPHTENRQAILTKAGALSARIAADVTGWALRFMTLRK